jgi:c-di-GMP-binding flagellar brake protein YcgR
MSVRASAAVDPKLKPAMTAAAKTILAFMVQDLSLGGSYPSNIWILMLFGCVLM